MTSRRRLSLKRFEKRHPGVEATVFRGRRTRKYIAIATRVGRQTFAVGVGGTPEEALYDLSGRCSRLASLEAMERDGWKDGKTGETGVPLQGHHRVHRAKSRNDSAENLVGLSQESHWAEHEGRRR